MSTTLKKIISEASAAGLVAPDKVDRLVEFLGSKGVMPGEAGETVNPEEDSEMPRFIRGYHDVLITIGILITLVGVGGLGTIWAALLAVIVLAEIFVRKQRLALPSFVLTLAFAICGVFTLTALVQPMVEGQGVIGDLAGDMEALVVGGLEFLLLAAFFWRYRVPVAFAALLAAGVGTIVGLISLLFFWNEPEQALTFTLLFAGTSLVIQAVRYDLGDRRRTTRRSDIAFWLYLVAVPAILKAVFSLLSPDEGIMNAALMLGAVVMMMVLGLIMDRRAFVTAGLVYLGYAFGELLSRGTGGWFRTLASDTQFLWLALSIGIVVLSVGIGWRQLRRLIIGVLPGSFQQKIPVVR